MHDVFIVDGLITFKHFGNHLHLLLVVPGHVGLLPVLCHVGEGSRASLEQEDEGLLFWIEPIYEGVQQLNSHIGADSHFLVDPFLVEGLLEAAAGVALEGDDLHAESHVRFAGDL